MTSGRLDPYRTLGVPPTASDQDVRAAYRRLVQRHHPDHNAGSLESARRFEEIQEAYAEVQRRRRDGASRGTGRPQRTPPPPRTPPRPPRWTATDAEKDARLADIERQVREAQLAAQRARQAAREAAAAGARRPSDEDLGYVTTDDTLSKILSDARAQASERLSEVREPVVKRVADLLDGLAERLNGRRE